MVVFGINAILETFEAGKTVEKVYVQKGVFSPRINKIISEAKSSGVIVTFADERELTRLAGTDKHQGAVAVSSEFIYSDFSELLEKKDGEPLLLVLLDGIEDPHNLGAVIRSCECFGVSGVIIPKRRSASVNETVIKASAGAAFHVKIAKADNLNDAIRALKDRFITVCAADMEGEPLDKARLTGDIALVLGGEGGGVHALTKKLSDRVLSIPMLGKVNSLNASVACGIMLYALKTKRLYS